MTIMPNKELLKRKQQYVILGALAFLGIVLLMLGNDTPVQEREPSVDIQTISTHTVSESADTVTKMEQKLAYTLSQIQGAGEVTVQITVKSSGKKEYAVDTEQTNRTTTESGTETTKQTTEVQEQQTIVQQNQNGAQQALLVETYEPEILGVLVVATGAEDAIVEEQLLHAVATVLQISLHQIMVVPGKERA